MDTQEKTLEQYFDEAIEGEEVEVKQEAAKKPLALIQAEAREELVNDSEIYISSSSVDWEPREKTEKDNQQQSLPGLDEEIKKAQEEPHERRFKVELNLSLAPSNGKAIKIPVVVGEFSSKDIKDILSYSLTSRRISLIIDAVLDNPQQQKQEQQEQEQND